MAPLYVAVSTRHDFRQIHTTAKTGELARLITAGIDASRIQKGLVDLSSGRPRRLRRKEDLSKRSQSRGRRPFP